MKAPTQLELMAFYDGELDEARAREVRAWLAAGSEGAALVENFRALGRHVRKAAPPPVLPPDLSDRIFAALDAEPQAPRVEPSAPPPERLAPVLTLRPPAPRPHAVERPLPVARRALGWLPLGATGMALAAAAAFVLWWSPLGSGPRGSGPAQAGKTVTPSAIAAYGTNVDTVDFGARMGSLFFVSNDTQATPVLWIDDDDDENDDTP